MNIGIDCRTLIRNSYGIGTYAHNVIQNLLRIDKENNYFLFFDSPDIPQFKWLTKKSKCVYVPFLGGSRKAGKDFAAPFWENISLPVYLKRFKIDVFLGPNYRLPLFTSVPGISVVHGMAPFALSGAREPWLFKQYFKMLVRFSVLKARHIISVSGDAKNDLMRFLRIPPGKITVIPLSVGPFFKKIKDPDLLNKVKEKYNLPEKYILFVGGLTARKNLPTLLRIFSILKQKGYPHKLVLCGGSRHGTAELLKALDELNLRDEVVLTGFVPYDETLAAIYSLADVYVLPSFHEACNLTLLEAMGCELPVIASKIPSLVEEVGDNAILIDPLDVNSWVANIENVLNDSQTRDKLINLGLQRIRKLTWEDIAKQTLAIIKENA